MIHSLNAYLMVAGVLFALGFWGVLLRRNILFVFMCLELMLSAVNIVFVAFARYHHHLDGAIMVFFTISVAAAEVAIGLAILVALYRRLQSVRTDDMRQLKN